MVYHTVSKSSVIKKKLCLPFFFGGGGNSVKTKKCVEARGYKICPKNKLVFLEGVGLVFKRVDLMLHFISFFDSVEQ